MRRRPTTRPAPPPRLLSSPHLFVRGAQTFEARSYPQTWPTCPSWGLAPSQSPRCHLRWGLSRRNPLVQAWCLAGSVMLAQGSSACACAGGIQRGASAMAAAADTPIIDRFISCSFPEPLMDASLSPPTQCRTLRRNRLAEQAGPTSWAAPPAPRGRPAAHHPRRGAPAGDRARRSGAAPPAHRERQVERPVGFTPARRYRRCTRARSRAGTG
ncbi:MAG: hypothetical protein QOD10_1884 [Mycobacterium sp.]|nr:hypothetical protein [Mycobacterium sp.]